MRGLLNIFAIAIVLCFSSSVCAELPPQVLMKGQSSTLVVDYDIGDVAVADPSVCDFLVGKDRRSFYINARGGGETIVTLWDVSGTKREEVLVRVVTTTLKEALEKAKQEFSDLTGVSVEVRGGHVEVSGEVVEPEDFQRIEGASRLDPHLRSHIHLAPDVIEQVSRAIEGVIGVPGITVRAIRDHIALEGVAYSQTDAKRAVEIARLYSQDVLDLIEIRETGRTVGRGRMIELAFHMMEIKRGVLREMGVSWTPGAFPNGSVGTAATGNGTGLLSSIGDMGRQFLGFVFGLIPKLKFIRERGDGRVLESPSILVKSGEVAKVFSGSEVPYYKGQDVQFKKVGIEIEASPVEVAGGVDLKFTATLSAPASDLRGALDSHTVSTTAICPFGQSLVLGNIIRNGDVKMKNRAPRDVDTSSALFSLFLSKDFQSNRSEFVVFVTPRLVDEPSSASSELKNFLRTEEAMIRDRSKKEFNAFASEHLTSTTGAILKNDIGKRISRKRAPKGRKWR